MGAQIHLTAFFQKLVGGSKTVMAEGATINALLDDLELKYPGFKEHVVSEDRKVHTFLNIYLNDDNISDLDYLDTPVSNGDQIYLVPAMAGGARPEPHTMPGEPTK